MRNRGLESKEKGIVIIFAWVSVTEAQLKDLICLYSSLGWNSLVCRSDYLNIFFPERATSLAFCVLDELIKELRDGLRPVVLTSFAGGSKACMYKAFQIISGSSEVELNMEDNRLVCSCISGQIYESDPIDFTSDFGARFALHRSILKMPGASKLVSLFAKGVSSSSDALFLTRFGSQQAEYWQTLYSSVNLGAPFLILHSENDAAVSSSTQCNFAQQIHDAGGNVKLLKWSTSSQAGQYDHPSIHYKVAVTELLEQAILVFSGKIKKLREESCINSLHDEISESIFNLPNAAVHSNQSFRRVVLKPDDHSGLPSSSENPNNREFKCLHKERKERSPIHSSPCLSANTLLGEILFDACVPKNVEGWDIKFSGSLNGEPFASVRRRSPFKHRSRL